MRMKVQSWHALKIPEDGAGAMKLVAELFPWSKRSKFIHSKDNHTSVIGIRGLAQNQGASIECIQAPTVTGNI